MQTFLFFPCPLFWYIIFLLNGRHPILFSDINVSVSSCHDDGRSFCVSQWGWSGIAHSSWNIPKHNQKKKSVWFSPGTQEISKVLHILPFWWLLSISDKLLDMHSCLVYNNYITGQTLIDLLKCLTMSFKHCTIVFFVLQIYQHKIHLAWCHTWEHYDLLMQ